MLINVKVPTIVGILTFMSRISFNTSGLMRFVKSGEEIHGGESHNLKLEITRKPPTIRVRLSLIFS